MESLNADLFSIFCQNYLQYVARSSSLTGDIAEVFSKFTKFPVAFVNEGGDKDFFAHHVITGLGGEISSL